MYFYMTNADTRTAFTEDFNTPVKVHVNVTSYICLTVYADPSTLVVRCGRVVNELASFSLPYLQCDEKTTVTFIQKATIVYLSCNELNKVATELPN